MVRTFQTKIVQIEAIQFDGDNFAELTQWTDGRFRKGKMSNSDGTESAFVAQVYDDLHQTWINVAPGQWIVRGAKGEFYPCDDETFHWKYEEVV